MKQIIIKSQEEFDALPNSFDELTKILITVNLERVTRSIQNGLIFVSDNATIQFVSGNATIQFVYDNATIQSVYDNATIKIYADTVCVKSIIQEAVIICQDCNPKLPKKIPHLIKTKKALHNLKSFCKIYEEQTTKDSIILYKSVNPETLCDFHTGKIKYEIGKVVECFDFNPDKEIECGQGLHLSPTPEMALSYNKGKVLKCEVKKKDIAVYPYNITKVRCKKVKVLDEVK